MCSIGLKSELQTGLFLRLNTVVRFRSIFKYGISKYLVRFKTIFNKKDRHKILLVRRLHFRILFSSDYRLLIYSTKLVLLIKKLVVENIHNNLYLNLKLVGFKIFSSNILINNLLALLIFKGKFYFNTVSIISLCSIQGSSSKFE